jgi:EAL domain-containing protein (putative c-di-GMP-specific phosphodiesterase class I)
MERRQEGGGRRAGDERALSPLAGDVADAIARDEVFVLFQPQVSLATGAVVGVEALARWAHPDGMLGAEALFAAAVEAGCERALSEHVQALALREASAWPAVLAGLRLAINVTADELVRADFAPRFLGRVRDSRFPVERLTAEVTETGLITDLAQAAAAITELRATGCRVAIDDFGTGYSSLAYLKSLPLDYLKIDRSLTEDIDGSARDQVLVRGVIDIARQLELKVIVEGVQTERQRAALADAGAHVFQGFLCAEPLDVAGLVRLVEG